ncbi:hypothetical protein RI129_003405 [Pyrocoelia pectoralis]|uniref:DRBM domain-containing protein n=1 Tax=Pyrocoelia pectoralis TaxID=417401 RepID=A0AAN7VQD1_9COLE
MEEIYSKAVKSEKIQDEENTEENMETADFLNDDDDDNDIRKFHVLDEIENNSDSQTSESDSDLPDDEVNKMLDAAFNESKKRKIEEVKENNAEKPFEEKDKVVLIQKGQNHFDILPEGWIQLSHNSGMPLYLHKASRVCTLSKPYFLGSGSARKHQVPLSAVPCLSYRRALEEELEQSKSATGNIMNARIETAQENIESHNLSPVQLQKYCEKLFHFRTIKIMRFKSWSHRRQFTKKAKHEKQLQRPTLPDGTKLITFPIQNTDGDSSQTSRREWIMNPNGKSYVCILHEYVQHALKKQPAYKFIELENAATPYAATISINDMQYGIGYGTSKKQAKTEAAQSALEILIPEMRTKIHTDAKSSANTSKAQNQDLSLFDEIKIEDPRVTEFCTKTTEPLPHDILLTCLQRNFGHGDIQVSYEGNTLKNQMNEYKMTVGKHSATVICKNKKDGKQRASQAILQALHPYITSWGSLLRLYGNCSVKSFKEKKLEEQEITLLQSKAAINSPNFAILNKLKHELRKLKETRNANQPIGIFIPPNCDLLPTFSSSNLKNVDL